MRGITVLLITCTIWGMLGGSTHAPASEIRTNPAQVESLEEEEEPPPSYSEEDLILLARLVHAEAQGEPTEGKIAVANVVLNRVQSSYFPNSIKGVIFQNINGRYQFCPVATGSIHQEPSPQAVEAAKLALQGQQIVTKDVYYFYNPQVAKSNWIRTRPVVQVIGNHNFAG